jgi:hypothetical protein
VLDVDQIVIVSKVVWYLRLLVRYFGKAKHELGLQAGNLSNPGPARLRRMIAENRRNGSIQAL